MTLACTIRDRAGEVLAVRGHVAFGGSALTLALDGDPRDAGIDRKVVIGVDEFAWCRFRRGLLGARMVLRATEEGAFGGVPGASDDFVTLQFAREDRDAAADLADRLRAAIVDAAVRISLRDIDGGLPASR